MSRPLTRGAARALPSRGRRAARAALLALACSVLAVGCSDGDDDDPVEIDPVTDGAAEDDGAPPATGGTPTEEDGVPSEDVGGNGAGEEASPDPAGGAQRFAFVSGNTPTFDAGQFERFTLGDEIVPSGTQPAASSDIRVTTDGSDFYQIGRFGLDTLTRYAPTELETPIWQYSVNGEESGANPYAVAFLNDTKAYVIRYGSPLVWIVDPSATEESAFLVGTIDLSAYGEGGAPNAVDAVIVDDRLYVLMQRLGGADGFTPVRGGAVAVVDTATDEEIDTAPDADGLPGIELETFNPASIAYLPDSEDLLVVSQGNSFPSEEAPADTYTGGLELVDLETLETELLLDDGTTEDNLGYTVDALVVSPEKGYLLTQASFGSTTLRTFDPRTGLVVAESVDGFVDRDLSVLALGPEGRLWVGSSDLQLDASADSVEPGFALVDPATDTVVVERVATQFNPSDIVFVDVPAAN